MRPNHVPHSRIRSIGQWSRDSVALSNRTDNPNSLGILTVPSEFKVSRETKSNCHNCHRFNPCRHHADSHHLIILRLNKSLSVPSHGVRGTSPIGDTRTQGQTPTNNLTPSAKGQHHAANHDSPLIFCAVFGMGSLML
jgi:hypothetical protein